jgi:signal transduction histidine kinase
MKLRRKFAIILLVITLVLSGVVLGQLEVTKQAAVERVEGNVEETAALTADQIDEEITRQRDYVGYFASRPGASNYSNAHAFLEEFLSNPRFYAVQTIDRNGTVVAFQGDIIESVRTETEGANVSDEPYASVPLSIGETFVSQPESLADGDRWVVIVSAPIFEDGEISGALAAAIELDRFSVFSTMVPLQTSTQTVSVRDGSNTLYEAEKQFEQAIGARATVPSTGWVVEVTRDRGPLNSRLRRMALMQAGSLLLILLMVVGLAVWEYSATLRQTNRLLEGFEALREGRHDHRLSLSAGEEWAQIGTGFNELADSLEERERMLFEREKQLSVLNRVLRHNLRNDMTIILNYATIVTEGAESDKVAEAARHIRDRGRHLLGLGDTARQVSEAIGSVDQPVELDLAEQVTATVAELREEYADAEIAVDVPDSAPVVVIPAFELAVEEVIDNGLKHNDAADPRLEISVTRSDGAMKLQVADNGPGIPEGEWAVFEGEEEPLEHGSGLGLWLIYWLVRKSDGSLSVRDNDPRGTVVTIVVPTPE